MSHSTEKRQVVIAGAGPGDPELITLKTLKAIQQADVILYDALVNEDVLKNAKQNSKLVYVGKRKGKKEFSQEEINQLIVFYACRYKNVLRLKGGDPFVFGRGHEELEFVTRRGIFATVIPGISTAIAAPSSIGIPVTKRGVNESFWVITGMLSSGEFSADLHLAAQSTATVVILMGMTHIEAIMKIFCKHRSINEPVAVVQHATLPNQKMTIGKAEDIALLVRQNNIEAPAVIIVGDVVNEQGILQIIKQEEVKVRMTI